MARLQELATNPVAQAVERELCRRDPLRFFDWWCWTYDPRNIAKGLPAYIPLDPWPRQRELIQWLHARVGLGEEGLCEKSRDIGWTWLAGGYALWAWLFLPGFKATFGSRKEEYVDRIGDPDSIFEKIRLVLYRLPPWMLPAGFDRARHDNHMRLLNPASGAIIRGEAGDQMGRGGRSTLYVVDEGAFIERAERVEAAIVANSDCRIWASSVNGTGNLFFRKRHKGGLRPDQIFRFHWRDDPRKTEEWAAQTQRTVDPAIWAAEYEIDYAASLEGLCIPAKWVQAAVDLAKLALPAEAPRGVGGLDVGAGKASSVFVARFGAVVRLPVAWRNPDTTETAYRGLDAAKAAGVARLNFDQVGVGAGVASTLSTAKTDGVAAVGINTGDEPSDVRWPDQRSSKEWFINLRAELWWTMRDRFLATFEHVLYLRGEPGGRMHPPDELIALTGDATELAAQLSTPRWFRNPKGKIQIESKQDMAKRGVASPDFADALALTFVPSNDPIVVAPFGADHTSHWSTDPHSSEDF